MSMTQITIDTGNGNKQTVKIDDYLLNGLVTIGITNWALFFSENIRQWQSGQLVKFCQELCFNTVLERSITKNPKTQLERFNNRNTAFDILVDYAFGGDKQAALEYLKAL